jgi:exonuclease VII small subunit
VLERRTRELEQVVARLTVEKVALESVLEEAQSHFGVDLKKTFGMGR